MPGQHLRRAAMADGEVRRGAPGSLRAIILEAPRRLEARFRFHDILKPHQPPAYRTPAKAFHEEQESIAGESNGGRRPPLQETESPAGAAGFSVNRA